MTFSVRHLSSVALLCCSWSSMAQSVSAPVAAASAASSPQSSVSPAAPGATPQALVPPSLQITNLFDKERKVWPDRVPPPPPPPPPPAPAAVTDQDMQLYGVVIAGSVKRATVKVGKRFASAAPEGRAFASLQEGQPLGEFTLAQIHPTHIVLQASGGQQSVYFTKKTDRGSAASTMAAAPVQGASTAPGESPPPATGQASPVANAEAAPAPAVASTQTAGAVNPPPTASSVGSPNAANPATAGGPGTPAEINIPNSLAAALAAARANASKGNAAPSGFQNPFMQKP